MYKPILGYFSEVNNDTLVNIREAMLLYFYISADEAYVRKENKQYFLFEWRVNTARNNLYHSGLLDYPRKGVYVISNNGSKVADSDKEVDREYLWNI